ncbi:MAG: acetate/propionate family kinase [Halioglobus sp.]|nr:acetate/propionate family kinase [Halioglobus sp.]
MTDIILIINAGSSSIKFALYSPGGQRDTLVCLFRGAIQDIGARACLRVSENALRHGGSAAIAGEAHTHEAALQQILEWMATLAPHYRLVAAGHRVVHGGMAFKAPIRLDRESLSRLQDLIPLAPMHQPHSLLAVEHLLSAAPELPQIACFDTAFHSTMPPVEQYFALPRAFAERGIRRYGFHGLSYEYIASVLPGCMGAGASGRVVVAHLGHGVSLCAMQALRSIATTMSFTPLDGLPMATRCGAIDAAAVLYLLSEPGMTIEALTDLLYRQSGLLGLSGVSDDIRTLLDSDSAAAAEAIAIFVQRIQREIGSLAAALGGLDALVFTGGIGEHSAPVRRAICSAAAWLGLSLDETANAAGAICISTADSRVSVWIIPTDEEQVVAQHTAAVLAAGSGGGAQNTGRDG